MRITSGILSLIIAFSSVTFAADKYQPRVPDQKLTPGDLCSTKNPDFDRHRYKEKIPYCERNVTTAQKSKIYEMYNVPESKWQNYTIDHFIPLSIGGSNAVGNLWPEHRKIKELRQDLEVEIFYQVERGEITQKEAIEIITDAKLNPPRALFDLADFLQ
jgi:hypothetical protein